MAAVSPLEELRDSVTYFRVVAQRLGMDAAARAYGRVLERIDALLARDVSPRNTWPPPRPEHHESQMECSVGPCITVDGRPVLNAVGQKAGGGSEWHAAWLWINEQLESGS